MGLRIVPMSSSFICTAWCYESYRRKLVGHSCFFEEQLITQIEFDDEIVVSVILLFIVGSLLSHIIHFYGSKKREALDLSTGNGWCTSTILFSFQFCVAGEQSAFH